MENKIDQILSTVERIGVIGSPSTTSELSLDILGSAVGSKLVGEIALFHFLQDGTPHYALGQITEVKLRNIWHEDPTMRSLIRQRGRVDAVSERQDTHQGEITVSAVFARNAKGYEPSILGTVPSTGTHIHLINDDVLDELLAPYGVTLTAEAAYQKSKGLNTLVIIDEAHRLAPREIPAEEEEAKAVRGTLIDAVRTTRKYGLGWMFISQTLSSLHSEILQQLRISFFGFGLALGNEYQALSQLVGGKSLALDLYRLFRDPHSSFDIASRQYSFMTIGPVSPLSFAGTPLFLNVFNSVDEFMMANNLKTA